MSLSKAKPKTQAMESKLAFMSAINAGLLSENPSDDNYAGNFMFMGVDNQGTESETLLFKHILTRKYIKL
jgi:hypothetical protein